MNTIVTGNEVIHVVFVDTDSTPHSTWIMCKRGTDLYKCEVITTSTAKGDTTYKAHSPEMVYSGIYEFFALRVYAGHSIEVGMAHVRKINIASAIEM